MGSQRIDLVKPRCRPRTKIVPVAMAMLLLIPVFAQAGAYTFTIVADNTGAYSEVDAPVINNAGVVAFEGSLKTGGSGIFKGSDPTTSTVATNLGEYSSLRGAAINDGGV